MDNNYWEEWELERFEEMVEAFENEGYEIVDPNKNKWDDTLTYIKLLPEVK